MFVGNEHVSIQISRAVVHDQLPHALIFGGPDGVGKKLLATELAKYLNCQLRPSAEEPSRFLYGCDTCSSCKKISAGTHPDVRIISPEETYIRIDQMRQIRSELNLRPFEGRERVYIIDQAEKLNLEASNSILKTLEEPPENVIIILVSVNPNALLPTIRSRCQLYKFSPIGLSDMIAVLKSEKGLSTEDAEIAAKLAQGSIGKAVSLDILDFRKSRKEIFLALRNLLKSRDVVHSSKLAQMLSKEKKLVETWLSLIFLLLRDMLVLKYSKDRRVLVNFDIANILHNLSSEIDPSNLSSFVESVKEAQRAIDKNANRQLTLEILFLNLMQALRG